MPTTKRRSSTNVQKVRVFLGSAKETAHVLHEFVKDVETHRIRKKKDPPLDNLWKNGRTSLALGDYIHFQSWDDPDTWSSGVATLDDVLKASRNNDVAVFFLGGEDTILSRERVEKLTRPNVWLEMGMFIAQLGAEKTLLLDGGGYPWGQGHHIPNDLSGITRKGYIGSKGFDFTSAISQLATLILPIANTRNAPEGPEYDYDVQAHVILGRKSCYHYGMELVKQANDALYSILSYPEEAKGSEQKQMEQALVEAIRKRRLGDIKRWIDLKNSDFLAQANALKEAAKAVGKWTDGGQSEFQIIRTDCKYIEAIISDDTTLLVFPDYERSNAPASDDQVGLGILVQHRELAGRLKVWCKELVGASDFKIGMDHERYPPNSFEAATSTTKQQTAKKPGSSKKQTRTAKAKAGQP